MKVRGRVLRHLSVLGFASVLCGCAVVWQDGDGTRHIVGLVAMEVRPPADPRTIAGEITDTQTLGFAVYALHHYGGVVVGWNREVSGALKNDVLVVGNPAAALRPRPSPEADNRS